MASVHLRFRGGMVALGLLASVLAFAGGAEADSLNDIFVISMENHNFTQPSSQTSPDQIFGNPAAPFQNSLITPNNPNAAQISYASNYQNAGVGIHPSAPNYIWSEAGSNLGVTNDNPPFGPGGNNQTFNQSERSAAKPGHKLDIVSGGYQPCD